MKYRVRSKWGDLKVGDIWEPETDFEKALAKVATSNLEPIGEPDAPKSRMQIHDQAIGHIQDLVTDFLYYDRKESEDFDLDMVQLMIIQNFPTPEELAAEFLKHLKNSWEVSE